MHDPRRIQWGVNVLGDTTETNSPDRWEIDKDEFGRPLIRHRHPTETIPAYLATEADGTRYARCTCGERYRLDQSGPAD
jgi:hypothetical protein